jgi:hypothetical protein
MIASGSAIDSAILCDCWEALLQGGNGLLDADGRERGPGGGRGDR